MRNKLAVFALLLTLCAGGAHAQVFNPETFTLKNGMEVVVLPNHRAPVVTHMIWLKAGGMDDPNGKSGIAHFQEHLMFKGTKNRAEGEYSKLISQIGGQENAFTSYDYTAYYATVGKEYLSLVMDLEADRLANWHITQAQLDAEKKVILKERQQTVDNKPTSQFWEKVNKAFYQNYPYGRPVIGWQNEIEKLSLDDITFFHKLHYLPDNMILVVSGDVTGDEVKKLAEKYYGPIRIIPLANPRLPASGMMEIMQETRRMEETSPQVKETMWSMHYVAPSARPDNMKPSDALTVLTKIMGDSRIGHLYRRLVMQEKLATNASVSFDPVARGPVRFSIVVTPVPGADLKRIEDLVNEEIDALTKKPVSDEEIKNATQALEVETIYARDSVMGPAMVVGESLASGLTIDAIESWPTRIKAVTAADVQKAAQDLFGTQKPLIAVLKPVQKVEKETEKKK